MIDGDSHFRLCKLTAIHFSNGGTCQSNGTCTFIAMSGFRDRHLSKASVAHTICYQSCPTKTQSPGANYRRGTREVQTRIKCGRVCVEE
ncbi:hypothetical protein Baya_1839 [Bagarius yarrelli]|uniref:Uncharacterized protein n=1 Tax=Bagarius yarrelli TaxID=175774 RepID=A0A556TM92_BAGYA|nr:hypothetical protein Baya_1839 [Bagarius yarrelli]